MPPAGEHADQAEPGPDLEDTAPGLADVGQRHAVPPVRRRPGEHVLQPAALPGLLPQLDLAVGAGAAQPLGQVVPQGLQRGGAEHAGHGPVGRHGGIGRRDGELGQLQLEVGDLAAQPRGVGQRHVPRRGGDHTSLWVQ